MITRPMKAPSEPLTSEQIRNLSYPVIASPKLDGFRCIVQGGRPYTASMKEIQNRFVRETLSADGLNFLDGELIVGDPTDPDVFHNTSGPLRRFSGEPDFKYYVFDTFRNPFDSFVRRWVELQHVEHPRVEVLEQVYLPTPEEVFAYEKGALARGYEGIMIRLPSGLYKQGRCTYNEMNMFKRKPFVICDAVIVGFVEAMENMNEQTVNELGLSSRSHRAEGLVPKGTLGSLWLKAEKWGEPFNARLGKGFKMEDNQYVWDNQDKFLGTGVKVKYQLYGSKDAPRIPSVVALAGGE